MLQTPPLARRFHLPNLPFFHDELFQLRHIQGMIFTWLPCCVMRRWTPGKAQGSWGNTRSLKQRSIKTIIEMVYWLNLLEDWLSLWVTNLKFVEIHLVRMGKIRRKKTSKSMLSFTNFFCDLLYPIYVMVYMRMSPWTNTAHIDGFFK